MQCLSGHATPTVDTEKSRRNRSLPRSFVCVSFPAKVLCRTQRIEGPFLHPRKKSFVNTNMHDDTTCLLSPCTIHLLNKSRFALVAKVLCRTRKNPRFFVLEGFVS